MIATENKQLADTSSRYAANKCTLLRRLSIVSLLVMLITASILIFLYRADQIAEHTSIAANENEKTIAYLTYSLDEQINAFVSNSSRVRGLSLQTIANLDALVSSKLDMIREPDVLKMKLYNQSGTIIYSTVRSEIGGTSVHPDFLEKAQRGETVHRVEFRDTFFGKTGDLNDVYVALTYMPLMHAGNPIGVIELYDDVTPNFQRLHSHIIQIALIVFGAFAMLYAALFFAVARADRAVAKWQKNIAESEALLRESQLIAGLGSYVLDIRTGLWQSSEVLDQLLGIDDAYERSQAGGWALIHPEERNMLADYLKNEVIGQGKTFDKEFRIIRHNDQAECWLYGLGKLEYDAQMRPLKMHGTLQDITARKLAEVELNVAAVAFETHDAILITDARSTIVRVNKAFSEITGYSAEEALGRNPRFMSSGRQDRLFYVEMWQQLLHAGVWSGEIWDKRKNGEIYPKWMTISVVKNQQQETSHYVAIFSDITARKKTEGEIHNLAFYDALTKLPNRRLFLDRFRAALVASARRNDYGAVLFIDMDRFKALNDTLGHDYGDLMLIEVGLRIKSCVREMDTVARYGGDEFVVLIDALGHDRDDVTHRVAQIAEKIREALVLPYKLKGHEHHSSPSIGISLYHGNEESLEMLIEHADMAMYQVKKTGRNAVRFFDPIMQHDLATREALENDLHHALALQQLQLHYQIQVDKDKRPLGAEAFLRWIHPEHGTIMPDQFIPVAEEGLLIIEIDRWVLKTVSQQLALWSRNDTTRDLTVTVNISAKLFAQPDFVDEIAGILRAYQADPVRLKLELSERLVLTDITTSMAKIQALKNLGVRLSMDNFGTVYSSLSYLKQLSPDQLKIHRDFVQGIALEGNDALLIKTVANLAKSLELGVFAEGVETEEQRTLLDSYNCDSYQGYLFGKPVTVGEFEKLLGTL
ncbi:MAG: EAL domain-containing protein [Gallionella sp.]|jgi:diguanylate cyclase (GGDEF)-like protein/PAS domain S-box-containing protein